MMLRSRAVFTLLGVVAAVSFIALVAAIVFVLPRDAMGLAITSAALHIPFGSGLLFAGAVCFAAGTKQLVSRSITAQSWIQGSAEVAALLATFAALGSTLKLRGELGAEWAAVWRFDQYVMFFTTTAFLYGGVALLARQRPSRQYAAALAVLGSPLPFLARRSLPSVCTLYSNAPPTLPSVVAAFSVAVGTGFLLAAFALFARTRLAHSYALLQRASHRISGPPTSR
jgi:hypothetical protein